MLYALLVAIGVLLALLVTLVPERPGAVAAGGAGGTAGEAAASGETSGGAPDGRAQQGAGGAAAGERPAQPGGHEITERYPQEEQPVEPPAPLPEVAGDLWWLPAGPDAGDAPGTLYLILDDAGNAIDPLPRFLEFPGPLAVAVLPQLPHSVESAARTAAAGKEIMLHLPMEAVGGAPPGPGAITSAMGDGEILRTIGENLDSVPGAVGINNHMGSAGTADARLMELVLAEARRRDLFFVDSRTTVDTVARPVAAYIGTRFAERNVFLDNERTRDGILEAVRNALVLAHRQPGVVMIGHATVPELASILLEIYPILIDHGYRFGAISDLVAPQEIIAGGG